MKGELKEIHTVKPFSKAKYAVVRAAARAVREDGPRAATLKNVAGRAGITEPAIFRHFDGVDGLFEGLFHTVDGACKHFADAFDVDAPPLAKLGKALRYKAELLASDIDLAYLVLYPQQIFGGYPELRARIETIAKQDRDLTDGCIAAAVAAGALRSDISADSLRAFSAGAAQSLIVDWVRTAGSFDLVQAYDALWDDFLKFAVPAGRHGRKRSVTL